MGIDIEALKTLLKSDDVSILLGQIKKISIADDRSALRVLCTILPDQIETTARMSWQSVGPDAGIFAFPAVGDLVLLGFVDSHEDQVFVISRLTSKEDKIPLQALDGSTVIRALSGKNTHVLSNNKIFLGKGVADPTENVVLGQVFKQLMSSLLVNNKLQAETSRDHQHIDSMGYLVTIPPAPAATNFQAVADEADSLKASPVDNENVLSNLSFTEK